MMRDLGRIRTHPVTAYTIGNALGAGTDEVAAALSAGVSGLRPCPLEIPFDTACGSFAGELEAPPAALARFDSRVTRIALAVLDGVATAAARAVRRWGAERVAVVLGTSTGGIAESERAFLAHGATGRLPADFDFDRQHAFHGLLEAVRSRVGARGPAYVVSTACSSSGKVLGSARRLIDAGIADAALVGGADSLCQTTLRGFGALEALAREPCRPFSALRTGTSIGEGAAFMLLEREGDGEVRLLAVGESSDAHHMSHPHPEGAGARLAMADALRQAGIEPGEVDHVNAHGTATLANDVIEAKAIADLLGTKVPVCSTKGYTGHLLGAAGITEAVFAALSITRGFIPASLGADPIDPAVPVDVCLERRPLRPRTVLSNSFAFGGSNVSVLLGAAV
jgi:3-oxoacyl-[acyl-carrier-protein] synthase-1